MNHKAATNSRIGNFASIATELALLGNSHLIDLLTKAAPLEKSIGGASTILKLSGKSIFVKQVPLTDIEKRPEHFMSTANLFALPTYCQYGVGCQPGVGSPGFGAWRELLAHIMTTN